MNDALLKTLVQNGLLDPLVAERVADESAKRGVTPETVIYEENLVREEEVVKTKSALSGVPYKIVDPGSISAETLKTIPAETARTYSVFPIARDKNLLVVGMVHPEDEKAKEALRFIAKQQKVDLGVYLVTPAVVEEVLHRYSPFQDEIDAALSTLNLRRRAMTGGAAAGTVILDEDRTVIAGEAPVIKIVSRFLKEAVNLQASDVHFEPQRSRLRIRFRIDGRLREVSSVPIEIHNQIISRIKILSKLRIDETRVPQDGRFRTNVFNRDIDFRVSTFPTPFGEKIAVRVLDPTVGLRGLSELGIVGKSLGVIQDGLREPYGLILMTGPTGSGKTTTLYALMQILNKEEKNIISLEDPVEYSIEGTNQSQVKPEIGYSFASGLRQILRQDPDIIMVGEIRDTETAELVVHAALTGHIVLSTLHTNNAASVIPRLIDLGVKPFLLAPTLNLMMAQRLVPRLCNNCKEAVVPAPDVKAIIQKELAGLPADAKRHIPGVLAVYRSRGCVKCNHQGTNGRVAVVEVFKMTSALEDIINQGITEPKIIEEARRQGMVTLRQDGILKALNGLVSIEEVLRETE